MPATIVERAIVIGERPVVTRLSKEMGAATDAFGKGLFLSAKSENTGSRLAFRLGAVPDLVRFSACHRYESYWMKPCAGKALSEVPAETQFLLAELTHELFLVLVPLFDSAVRFSLRGLPDDTLELLGETGDAFTSSDGGLALYVAAGADPFALVREGARSVQERIGTGRLRRDKPLPDFVDDFGWCTWDAFYQEVSAEKVREGLEQFERGGVSPRYLILDDGWQSVEQRPTAERRLTSFAANQKFAGDLRPTVKMAKERFGLRNFLVWHSMVGYWGGVDGDELPGYGVVDQTRQFGEGILRHEPTANHLWWGNLVGFVPPAQVERFFDDYHRSLAEQGVDGIKVDSQAVLEAVSERHGGRVAVTRAYRSALESSAQRHFGGRLINCMSNAQETYYLSFDSTLLRTSIDFFPNRPESHGMHLYANAQVGLWFGEFMHPDWDMFQSGHAFGAYHAAARAVSGGPVYVSDKPGKHDFELLRSLTCFDGSVLRCDGPALLTADLLCRDPTRERVLCKVWNRSADAAVIGAFHAQTGADTAAREPLYGTLGPSDVPGLEGEDFACYSYRARKLELLGKRQRREVVLEHAGYELFTLAPLVHGFAPIGLTDKMNSRAAVRSFRWDGRRTEMRLRDGGDFLAFSEHAPEAVHANGQAVKFEYDTETQALRVALPSGRQYDLILAF